MHSFAANAEINASIKPNLTQRTRRKRRCTRFPNIHQDAETLHVNRTQLWLVLTGQRPGADTIASYTALLTQQGRPIPADLGKAA